jgi:hypothetical protein
MPPYQSQQMPLSIAHGRTGSRSVAESMGEQLTDVAAQFDRALIKVLAVVEQGGHVGIFFAACRSSPNPAWPCPAVTAPADQPVTALRSSVFLNHGIHGLEFFEFAALQPNTAAAYPDRIGAHRGQDYGVLARPQHRTMADCVPDLILGVGGAELAQACFKPGPASGKFSIPAQQLFLVGHVSAASARHTARVQNAPAAPRAAEIHST